MDNKVKELTPKTKRLVRNTILIMIAVAIVISCGILMALFFYGCLSEYFSDRSIECIYSVRPSFRYSSRLLFAVRGGVIQIVA